MKRFSWAGLAGAAALLLAVTATADSTAPSKAIVQGKVPDKIKLAVPDGMKPAASWIKVVEFDHAVHRGMDACVKCHHMDAKDTPPEKMQPCRSCHMDNTTKDSSSFYAAWHSSKDFSCVGCHRAMGATVSCTNGCHKRPGKAAAKPAAPAAKPAKPAKSEAPKH